MPELDTFSVAVVANAIIYSSLGAGLWRLRRAGLVSPDDPPAVFRRLEKVLSRLYPDSKSDTLRELLERAMKSFPQFDWKPAMEELDAYEAYKFGGKPVPSSAGETFKLVNAIRGRKV